MAVSPHCLFEAPINRNQAASNDPAADQARDRAAPPLAQPIYRPAPAPAARSPSQNDFADLPGEEMLVPNNNAPPAMQNRPAPSAPKAHSDALGELIEQVE